MATTASNAAAQEAHISKKAKLGGDDDDDAAGGAAMDHDSPDKENAKAVAAVGAGGGCQLSTWEGCIVCARCNSLRCDIAACQRNRHQMSITYVASPAQGTTPADWLALLSVLCMFSLASCRPTVACSFLLFWNLKRLITNGLLPRWEHHHWEEALEIVLALCIIAETGANLYLFGN